MSTDSRGILIEKISHEGKIINLIQDGIVPGGTKGRAAGDYLRTIDSKVIVYAGPATGYAQVALAHWGKILDKKIVLFLSGSRPIYGFTKVTKYAKQINPSIEIHLGKILKDCTQNAINYCSRSANNIAVQGAASPYLLKFGFDDELFISILGTKLLEAGLEIEGKTVWITVGSGTVLRTLLSITKTTKFKCVTVGKGMYEDQYSPSDWTRLTIYKAPEYFTQDAVHQPPYNSLSNYDAKLWQFAMVDAQHDDYIFNIASRVPVNGIPAEGHNY